MPTTSDSGLLTEVRNAVSNLVNNANFTTKEYGTSVLQKFLEEFKEPLKNVGTNESDALAETDSFKIQKKITPTDQ